MTQRSDNTAWFNDHIDKANKEGLISVIKEVDADLASFLLEKNPDNRNFRPAKMKQYVSDMVNGRWESNGESIIISKTGELNDGQHRLRAVVESKVKQAFLFVFGPTRSSRATVDTGSARSAKDHLGVSGIANASHVAGIARWVLAWEGAGKENLGQPGNISSAEIIEFAKTDALLQEVSSWVANHSKKLKPFAQPSVLGFVFYAISTAKPTWAKQFMEGLREGIGLSKDDPIRVVREKLMTSPRLSPTQRIELLFRAWNHYVKNTKPSSIPVMSRLPKLES